MSNRPLIAVVTGANRGIGRAICSALMRNPPAPMVLYAASRAGTAPDVDIPTKDSSNSSIDVRPVKLSLSDAASIAALSAAIRRDHGRCDVLINNAGVFYFRKDISAAERKETLDVNFRGTMKLCEAFIPLMPPAGRIVNVSSQAGQMKHFHARLHARFLAPDLTLSGLNELVQEYDQAAARGDALEHGWPAMAYFASKAAVNAGTRILAREHPHLLVNCCCPGWVATGMGEQAGVPPKTADEGARIPLRLGFGDVGGVSGRYWANESVGGKGEGSVLEW
ncbi:uncharacterized protein K452DRAFT_322144 [Aplosporella prunicola CBS 121167]|uniref:NAD(P)-binding protein n=1 Tax=Aplosporella prunicola CBS 121167 TaxID=1176127 RepID=A0A6A6AYA6_9PEZI|nr:uncharacterized protein K452DRAFT_322144 [Aplosporella prunicola CBS 121167]KAF2136912.1 hypothetical protein K452DRAFT_322144 [Aplosporella prunicola CBS 121167]